MPAQDGQPQGVAPTTNKRPRGYRFPNCTYNNQSRHRRGWVFQPIGRGDLAPTIVIFLKSRHTSYAVTPNSTGKMGNFSNHVSHLTFHASLCNLFQYNEFIEKKRFHILTHLLTHVGTLTKKTGNIPTKSEHAPNRTETEFFHKLGFSN